MEADGQNSNYVIDPGAALAYSKRLILMRPGRFTFEREFLRRGISRIAGADEAGRGPLAGPVVAAVVCLPREWIERGLPRGLQGLNDSKQLTEPERERFFAVLTAHPAVACAVASIPPEVIDAINILRASLRAMNEALSRMVPRPEHVLVDGPHVFSATNSQTPIIDGDARSYSIAAASVIAKVTRDRLMTELDKRYPEYGFAEHKGYATPRHLAALERFGPCPIHRRTFAPCRAPEPDLFS